MKLKKRMIIFLILLLFLMLSGKSYAKYKYSFEDNVIHLSRDGSPITTQVSYSTEDWTHGNVIVTIKTNKPIEQVSGFTLSEDKMTLKKEVSQNESGTVIVRDLSGNFTEVEYSVTNIDKEMPQIIGCEDGKTYNAPLSLDYKDNIGIKSVTVNKYGSKLSIKSRYGYHDNASYFGTDRTSNMLRVNVLECPLNTEKYKYYLNNNLYAITNHTQFIYTGITSGVNYTIKVEAIDKSGNVLDTATTTDLGAYYESIDSNKTSNYFTATLNGLDSRVARVRYAVWNDYYNDTRWYDCTFNNRSVTINCSKLYSSYPAYTIHVYFYDVYGNSLDVLAFRIDFSASYTGNNSSGNSGTNVNLLKDAGNYQIKVIDLAGNEVVYYIKVQ